MNTDTEKRIEEARVAFTEAWEAEDRRVENEDRDARGTHSRSRAGIRAALAVFEKAHTPSTPTDDREAAEVTGEVAGIIDRAMRPWGLCNIGTHSAARALIAAGLRRTSVPETVEYGVTYVEPRNPATITQTMEEAHESQRFYNRIGHGKYVSTILQRTKGVAPGPWTAVNEQGEGSR